MKIRHRTELSTSYRAARVASRLDDGRRASLEREIVFEEPPGLEEDWRVGLIVGASGSGKSSVLKTLYGGETDASSARRWGDGAVVDEFADCDFDRLESALAAVGFGSPVRQLQRFSALSAGERFRCQLARTLLEAPGPIAVVDEFTSALDRPTAKSAAAATRRALDRGVFEARRLVAATCHDDVAEWLEPDWILDMDSGLLARGRLRRPETTFAIRGCSRALWRDFKDFHYLSGTLNAASRRYAAILTSDAGPVAAGTAVAFAAILQCEGRRGRRRVHRLVVRPELQGLGIGGAFLDALGDLERRRGATLEIVCGVPFFIRRLVRSPRWRRKHVYPSGRRQRHRGKAAKGGSFGRAVVSFEYKIR